MSTDAPDGDTPRRECFNVWEPWSHYFREIGKSLESVCAKQNSFVMRLLVVLYGRVRPKSKPVVNFPVSALLSIAHLLLIRPEWLYSPFVLSRSKDEWTSTGSGQTKSILYRAESIEHENGLFFQISAGGKIVDSFLLVHSPV
jgi:hypothetical protein